MEKKKIIVRKRSPPCKVALSRLGTASNGKKTTTTKTNNNKNQYITAANTPMNSNY